jgi:hypothetical protein
MARDGTRTTELYYVRRQECARTLPDWGLFVDHGGTRWHAIQTILVAAVKDHNKSWREKRRARVPSRATITLRTFEAPA